MRAGRRAGHCGRWGPGRVPRDGHPRRRPRPCSGRAPAAHGSRRSSAPTCTASEKARRDETASSPPGRVAARATPTNRAAGELWVPWDRTAGVIGPQGSGKTLDLLIPALLAAPGAALVTLTKADDLLLSIDAPLHRRPPVRRARPVRARPGSARAGLGPDRRVRGPAWSPRRAPRPSPPAPSSGAGAGGQGTTPPGSTPPRPPRSSRRYFHAAALTGRTLRATSCAGSPTPSPPSEPHRDPARAPARRAVLARAAARGAARGRPHRRQHHHHRPTGPVAVLPGGHPPPLRPRPGTPGHRTSPTSSPPAAPSTCSAGRARTSPRHR